MRDQLVHHQTIGVGLLAFVVVVLFARECVREFSTSRLAAGLLIAFGGAGFLALAALVSLRFVVIAQ